MARRMGARALHCFAGLRESNPLSLPIARPIPCLPHNVPAALMVTRSHSESRGRRDVVTITEQHGRLLGPMVLGANGSARRGCAGSG